MLPHVAGLKNQALIHRIQAGNGRFDLPQFRFKPFLLVSIPYQQSEEFTIQGKTL